MNRSIASLSELKHMVIREDGYRIPVGALRADAEPALEAIRAAAFFARGDQLHGGPAV